MKGKTIIWVCFLETLLISGNLASLSQFSKHDGSIVHPRVADQSNRGQEVSSLSVNDSKEGASAFPCPDPSSISPCICSEETSGLQLDCSEIESDEQLLNVFFANFPVTSFWRFIMSGNYNNIEHIYDIFNGITFREIIISIVPSVLTVSGTAFSGSWNTLEYLDLFYTQLNESTFPFSSLNRYPNLQRFHFVYGNLQSIPRINSTSITDLNLYSGYALALPSNTFDLLPSLTRIDVSYHELPLLETSTFHLLNEYNELHVHGNSIRTVQPGTFVLPQFTDNLSLSMTIYSNELTTLDQETWGDIMPYITSLEVNDNPLECGCDIAWIITNPDYLGVLEDYAPCADGTLLTDLDPTDYENLCNQQSDQTEAKQLIRHRLQPTV